MYLNVSVCVVHPEPRTQDSRGGPDDEDEDGEEQGPAHSGGEEEKEGEEEEEALHWRGPGQCTHRGSLQQVNMLFGIWNQPKQLYWCETRELNLF